MCRMDVGWRGIGGSEELADLVVGWELRGCEGVEKRREASLRVRLSGPALRGVQLSQVAVFCGSLASSRSPNGRGVQKEEAGDDLIKTNPPRLHIQHRTVVRNCQVGWVIGHDFQRTSTCAWRWLGRGL